MAVNYSKNLLKKRGLFFSYRAKPFSTLFFKSKKNALELMRKHRRKKFIKVLKPSHDLFTEKVVLGKNFNQDKLLSYSKQYDSESYTFIEDFFDKSTYDMLCDSFPHEVFFNSRRSGSKFYNWSEESRWTRNDMKTAFNSHNSKTFFDIYPFYRKLYDFLNSSKMSEKVKIITQSEKAELYSIALTRANEGSFLSPHMDQVSVGNKSDKKVMINFIYFLLAGGASPERCGGTGLYNDNEFNSPIFIPTSMRNTALIYDSVRDFYHGFDITDPGSFRWAIAFQFKIS